MNINNDDDDDDGDNNNNNEWYIQEVAWFELYGFLYTFHEKLKVNIFELLNCLSPWDCVQFFLSKVIWTNELLFRLIPVWDTTPENVDYFWPLSLYLMAPALILGLGPNFNYFANNCSSNFPMYLTRSSFGCTMFLCSLSNELPLNRKILS